MKYMFLVKVTGAVGLLVLLCTMASTVVQKTARADATEAAQAETACSDAYFDDPDFMYSFQTMNLSEQQHEAIDQASAEVGKKTDAVSAEVTTFSVELDAPIGYVTNIENSKAVEIPLEVEEAINQALYGNDDISGRRDEVAVLNKKYGQYATFGQQITLIFSPEQARRVNDGLRGFNAQLKNILTDEQKQAFQELQSSEGNCGNDRGFDDLGSLVVEIGQRSDLDQRLREDTSNTTFFD